MKVNGDVKNNIGDIGLQWFGQMEILVFKPSEETFLVVGYVCGNANVVEEASLHFESMENDFGNNLGMQHDLGVISVLGKCGCINEIVGYVWYSQLWKPLRRYACSYNNVEIEEHTDELIIALDPLEDVPNKIVVSPPKENSDTYPYCLAIDSPNELSCWMVAMASIKVSESHSYKKGNYEMALRTYYKALYYLNNLWKK